MPCPDTFRASVPARGATEFTVGDLVDEFSIWILPRNPGEAFQYSNTGYAILAAMAATAHAGVPMDSWCWCRCERKYP